MRCQAGRIPSLRSGIPVPTAQGGPRVARIRPARRGRAPVSRTVSTDAEGHTTGWATTGLGTGVADRPDPAAAAFFDIDNTMMQGASIYWFARGLAARRYFTTGDLARFAWQQMRFRVLATEHAGDMSQAREAALAFVEGWRVEDIERLTEEIFDELMAPRIWAGSRALAAAHLAAGQRVWLVSAAPVEIGRVIARRLGLTGAIGTVAEIRDGAYTGRLAGELMHGPAKADAVGQLASVEGLELSRCTAYSDSANDIPMLSAVGNGVAVNPDSALRVEARTRGWEIHDFRTGRRAVRIAIPSTVAAGLVIGAVTAGRAVHRRWRDR
ncbi:HAD family hydrolase [Polymorphospora rubra]|uniref:HAD family hydrolase n=1 Tax=Polymorphospora rubra TaxID=338584 RepID=UPI003F4CC9DA